VSVEEGYGVPGGNPPGMLLSGRTDFVSRAFTEVRITFARELDVDEITKLILRSFLQHCLSAIQATVKTRAASPQLVRAERKS
jgi:hypothetical protein